MSLLVLENKIATCFVFSWPGLMLASAAQRLFISSCAVAIYPAASADHSTISHQQQWNGCAPVTHRQLPNIVAP